MDEEEGGREQAARGARREGKMVSKGGKEGKRKGRGQEE